MLDNDYYGGFVVSNNILKGIPVRYTFREESFIPQLNGWTLYSAEDDEDYVNDFDNFTILNAESLFKYAPVMLGIFDAPYGTDLCWLYEQDVVVGFWDLANDRETTIDEILGLDKNS